jgi:hypothetical protein
MRATRHAARISGTRKDVADLPPGNHFCVSIACVWLDHHLCQSTAAWTGRDSAFRGELLPVTEINARNGICVTPAKLTKSRASFAEFQAGRVSKKRAICATFLRVIETMVSLPSRAPPAAVLSGLPLRS